MSDDEARKRPQRYTLRPVTTPLAGGHVPGNRGGAGALRGEGEDDDGYDPYSDVHDGTSRPLEFEADPWS